MVMIEVERKRDVADPDGLRVRLVAAAAGR